jgi:hypothetical protein
MTAEDENLAARVILKAVSSIFDLLPVAYALRIETIDAHVYQHSGPGSSRLLPSVTPSSSPLRPQGLPARGADQLRKLES